MPEFDKLSSYADRAALEKETAFVISKLKEIEEEGLKTAKSLKGIQLKIDDKNSGIGQKIKDMKDFAAATDLYGKKVTYVANEEKKLAAIQKQLSDERIRAAKETKNLVQVENEVIKQITLEEKATQANIKTKKEALTFEQALEKQKAKGASASAAEAKIADELTNEYAQLNKALRDAEIRYKNLALATNFQGEAQEEALQEALKVRAVLDKLDINLRNNQRNVGNYKSAFDGLGFSFTQVARELPSLTISAQQFFLAISNNLPMVFDEIKRAKVDIAALKAEGLEAPSIASRVAKSLFSWNVAIAVGITLLTAFGGKILEGIKSLFGFVDAEEVAAKATAKLQQAQLELIKTQKELNELYSDPINSVDRLEEELKLSQNLNKSRKDILEIEKQIAFKRGVSANEKFFEVQQDNNLAGFAALEDYEKKLLMADIKYSELITQISKTTDEEEVKELEKKRDRIKIELDLYKEKVGTQKKIIQENYASLSVIEQNNAEIEEYNREQKLLKEVEFAKIRYNTIIEANERIFADERNFEAKKIAALKAEAIARKKIVDADLQTITKDPKNKNATRDAEGSFFTAEAKVAIKKANADRIKIEKDLQVEIFNVREEFRKRFLAAVLDQANTEFNERINFNKNIIDADYMGYKVRIEALGEYVNTKKDQVITEAKFEKATKILTADELLAIEKATDAKLNAILREALQQRSDIITSSNAREIAQYESNENRRLSLLKLINAKFSRNKKERDEKNEREEYSSQRTSLLLAIDKDYEQLKSSEVTAADKEKVQTDLNGRMAALYKLDTDHFISEQDKKLAAIKRFGEITSDVFDLMASLVERDQIIQKNVLRDQMDEAEKKAARDIELVNASTLSEQDKAAKIAIINARSAAQKEQFAKREREIELQKAKFEKTRTIFSITLKIAEAFASGNYYQAILGGIQLAIAAATPLPRYFKGKKKGEGKSSMAIVDDGGTPEPIVRADGTVEMGGNTPRVTYIDQQDEVFKNKQAFLQSMQLTAMGETKRVAEKQIDNTTYEMLMLKTMQQKAQLEIENQRLLQQIADKPVQMISGSEKGVDVMIQWASRRVSYIEDRTNF
jgi:hypothetical protein